MAAKLRPSLPNSPASTEKRMLHGPVYGPAVAMAHLNAGRMHASALCERLRADRSTLRTVADMPLGLSAWLREGGSERCVASVCKGRIERDVEHRGYAQMMSANGIAGFFRFERGVRVAVVGVVTLSLAACGGGAGSIFGPIAGTDAPAVAALPAESGKAKLAFLPVVGAPADISAKLNGSVVAAMERQSVPVARAPGEAADYTVRGYVVAAPGAGATKVTYIWDVSDRTGQRAHRVKGEELVGAKKGQDPWAAFDDKVISKIAEATSSQLAAWVPMKAPAVGVPIANADGSVTKTAQATATAANNTQVGAVQGGSLLQGSTNAQPVSLAPASASTGVEGQVVPAALPANTKLAALIVPVIGASGDGEILLTQAIQKHLGATGTTLVSAAAPNACSVQGKVTMGQPQGGKQTVKIEWIVTDPAGKRVGTVTQSNIVPQGSLDGTWGRTADLAAREAAKGVADLLKTATQLAQGRTKQTIAN